VIVSQSQEGRMVAAVEAIYAAALTPASWPDALHRIAEVFDDVGALLVYQREDGGFGHIVSEGLKESQSAYQNDHWWRNDLRMSRSIERGYHVTREAITERDIVTDDELSTLPFYVDFLAAYGLKWFAGLHISPDPKVLAALSVQRLAVNPAYTESELAVVGQLGRHVEAALRLGIRLIDAEVASLTLAEILARLGVGVFLIDDASRIVFANPAAQRLLDRGVFAGGNRLAACVEPEREKLAAAISAVLDRPAGGLPDVPLPVMVSGADEATVAVYVLPLVPAFSHPFERLMSSARAIVVVIEPSRDAADPAIVRDLLGLTLGEARVAALVGGGMPPADTAALLGITPETARTVLKRVFAKTGVSSQSQLAGLLSRLVLR
jgi:DNA-binding CsgD family transcriptional regulator/PAS domain-containing protein